MPQLERIGPAGYVSLREWARARGFAVTTVSTWVNAARVEAVRHRGRWYIKNDTRLKRGKYDQRNTVRLEPITISTVSGARG